GNAAAPGGNVDVTIKVNPTSFSSASACRKSVQLEPRVRCGLDQIGTCPVLANMNPGLLRRLSFISS
ncbi:hypothetical protein NPIL_336311, partial [Nephila pilipes]